MWRVTGPVAVVLIEGSTRYIEHGGVFTDGENVAHLAAVGLIEEVPAEPETPPEAVKPRARK